jgi:hypothetical protein
MGRRRLNSIIHGEIVARPKKDPKDIFLKDHFSYPPRQREKVESLKKARKLSKLIQDAIDNVGQLSDSKIHPY